MCGMERTSEENEEVGVSMKRLADSKETSPEKGEAGCGLALSLGCAGFKEHPQKSRMQRKERDSSSQTRLHSIC